MTDDFDWSEFEASCIVQQRVMRVAIYGNPNGDLVIRQERDWDEEQDPWIVIARENEQMRKAIELGESQAPKDATAAERQRRRRAKLKGDADAESRVTERDALPLIAAE